MTNFESQLEVALNDLASPAKTLEPNWEDVTQRSQLLRVEPRQAQRRRVYRVAALMAATVGLLVIPPLSLAARFADLLLGTPVSPSALGGNDWTVLSSISAGKPMTPASVADHSDVVRFGVSGITQVGVTKGHAFYVIHRMNGPDCYAVGLSGGTQLFGLASCGDDTLTASFPSRSDPIYDLSVYSGDPLGAPEVSDLQGFAADGVASVALLDRQGSVMIQVPVENNVYERSTELPIEAANQLAAYDAHGKKVFTRCLVPAGCA
jgi:hypothetical protein